MILLLLLPSIGASLSGFLCGYLGLYLKRLGLMTITFTVLHGVLAGAAISLMLSIPPEPLAFMLGVLLAVAIEYLHEYMGIDRDAASMALFSFASALAMMAVFMTPSKTLTSESASLILWGSILAINSGKLVLLTCILVSVIIYVLAFKLEIKAILFDPELAEAEGINVKLHALILIILIAITITASLKLIGGFMLFALLYNPIILAERIRTTQQALVSGIIGAVAGSMGVIISYLLDTPTGATVALTASTILIIGLTVTTIGDKLMENKILEQLHKH